MKVDELAELCKISELPEAVAKVESRLEQIATNTQASIQKPAMHALRAGGKRLRPILTIVSTVATGSNINEQTITAAVAIELVHLSSLVHDDILDNAATRGGQPTINASSGTAVAVLVGDYLLGQAVSQAATLSQGVAENVAQAIAILCDGQAQEMTDSYNTDRSVENYLSSIEKKTAHLLSAACLLGGTTSGANSTTCTALSEFGKAFGMSFQLIDDLLDFLSSKEAMGKPVGNDVKEGVYSLPLLLSLAGSSGTLLKKLLDSKTVSPSSNKKITKILTDDGSFAKTLDKIRAYNETARLALQKLPDSETLRGLAELPRVYMGWALQKQSLLSL